MPDTQTTSLSFNDITPYVRYVQHITLDPGVPAGWKKLYDHRLTYVCGGKGEIHVEESIFPCQKGDLLYWGPDILYAVHRDATEPLTLINVHFDFTLTHRGKKFMPPAAFLQHFEPGLITERIHFTDTPLFNRPFHIPDYMQGEGALLLMAEEYKLRKNFNSQLLNGMLLSFLAYLSRHLTCQTEASNYRHLLADQIIEHIHQNYDKPLTNKAIAERFNFHPNYLNRLFIGYTGTSLYQYILHVKANKAVELLHSTALSVTDIAQALGFYDIGHFSKFFKERVGCSPSKLR